MIANAFLTLLSLRLLNAPLKVTNFVSLWLMMLGGECTVGFISPFPPQPHAAVSEGNEAGNKTKTASKRGLKA